MRVLIAPDKFKGSLTAAEAAAALAQGWTQGWPGERGPLEIERLPVADGGEGTAEAICDALHGRWITCAAHDANGRPIQTRYALAETAGERVAVLEMSEASGLWRVTPTERVLSRATSFGAGEMLRHALTQSGADRVILGIGGSATNDGGMGLAAALGCRFFGGNDQPLELLPVNLHMLARIEWTRPFASVPILVACDVSNPLLGERGATRVYGPQKGLSSEAEAALLEDGLTRLADVAARAFGEDHRHVPGAGAAGGLGFGLMTFCHARLRPGFELVAELLHLDDAVKRADLIITGEGSLDGQTLDGKAPAGVAAVARRHGKPVLAFAGRVADEARDELGKHFDFVCAIRAEVDTHEESMARAEELLVRCAARSAAAWA